MLAPVLEQARNTSKLNAVPATMQGVREFVRGLRRGNAVGLLPDQAPGTGDGVWAPFFGRPAYRSEEHTSELQSLMRISYAVFCLKKKNKKETDKDTQIYT